MFVFMFFVALAWGQQPTASTELTLLEQANAQLILAQAELTRARTASVNKLVIGEKEPSSTGPCGDPPDYNRRLPTRRYSELAMLYQQCLEADRDQMYAQTAQLGIVNHEPTYSNPESGVLATGDRPATMAAANDVPMGAGFNGLARLPYGASVFDTFQGNTMTVQMLLAGQQMPIAPRQPLGQPTPVTATRTDLEDAARAMQAAAQ